MRFTAALLYTLLIVMKEIQVSTTDEVNADDECSKQYFYKRIPPTYLNIVGDKFICQKRDGISYFVSRYSTNLKIPIYSAYKIDSFKRKNYERGSWNIDKTLLVSEQASNENYTGHLPKYDRGHLNPRCHNRDSKDRIKVTYNLTNAVPMSPTVNKRWYSFAELPLFRNLSMDPNCSFDNATRYIITGVIPGNEWMSGVNIPEYVWTAALCVNSNHLVSVGYLMKTTSLEDNGRHIAIQDLETQLRTLTQGHIPGSEVLLFHNLSTTNVQLLPKYRTQRPRGSCSARSHRQRRPAQPSINYPIERREPIF